MFKAGAARTRSLFLPSFSHPFQKATVYDAYLTFLSCKLPTKHEKTARAILNHSVCAFSCFNFVGFVKHQLGKARAAGQWGTAPAPSRGGLIVAKKQVRNPNSTFHSIVDYKKLLISVHLGFQGSLIFSII